MSEKDKAGVAVDNTTGKIEVDILHSIKPIEVEGMVYSPHKGEEGVSLPDKLGKAMIKRGFAQRTISTPTGGTVWIPGYPLKQVATYLHGIYGTISELQSNEKGITIKSRDFSSIIAGKVKLEGKTKGNLKIAFDSFAVKRTLAYKRGEKGEEEITNTWSLKPYTGYVPDTNNIHTYKDLNMFSFTTKAYLSSDEIKAVKAAIHKTECKYLVLVAEKIEVTIYLYDVVEEKLTKIVAVPSKENSGSIEVAFLNPEKVKDILKGLKGKERLLLKMGDLYPAGFYFKMGTSAIKVVLAPCIEVEERAEIITQIRKGLNPSPSVAEEEKKAKDAIDRIQEQERREQEKHKEEQAFKETEETVKKWKDTYKGQEVKEIREDVSFLTVREATGAKLTNSKDVYLDMQAETKVDRECMWALHLDGSNKIVKKEMVAMGRGNSAQIAPREVYRRAIIEGAVAVILVHNHPSGDPAASEGDKICSENMKKAGMLLGVPLLDFMIVAKQGYTSFADKGIGGF